MPLDPRPTRTAATVNDPLKEFGSWGCLNGTGSESFDFDEGVRIVGLLVVGGTFQVNANDVVDTANFGGSFTLNPKGNIDGADLTITGSTSYFIEIVKNGEVP